MKDFVHLHNHTDYSLQDAAQTVQMMCNRVDALGMDTIAVTEHGNLFSMVPFYKKAQKLMKTLQKTRKVSKIFKMAGKQ